MNTIKQPLTKYYFNNGTLWWEAYCVSDGRIDGLLRYYNYDGNIYFLELHVNRRVEGEKIVFDYENT